MGQRLALLLWGLSLALIVVACYFALEWMLR